MQSNFKRTFLAAALIAASFSAAATGRGNNNPPDTPEVAGTQQQGQAQLQLQGQAQGQQQQANGGSGYAWGGSAAGGAGGVGGNGGDAGSSLNSAIAVGGTLVQRNTPPSYAPPGSGPLKSCRLFMGAGGAGTGASGSGGFPIGNDMTCLVDAREEMMVRINKAFPSTFTLGDFMDNACQIEGMDAFGPCKANAQAKANATR